MAEFHILATGISYLHFAFYVDFVTLATHIKSVKLHGGEKLGMKLARAREVWGSQPVTCRKATSSFT